MEDNRFSIKDVCDALSLPVDYRRGSANIECPICGKAREKKLNINFSKNAFRCAKCGMSGYAVHLWALYRDLSFADLAAVTRDYYSYVKGCSHLPVVKSPAPVISQDAELAPIDVRDKTYTALLELLSLSDYHHKNLIKRGLSDAAIEKNGYKSYPVCGHVQFAQLLLSRGCILKGCPGFYQQDDGIWTLRKFPKGFLIPQRDGFGRIQGLQLRCDEAKGSKYLTLSTSNGYRNGSKGCAYAHFSKGEKGLKEVIITEGPLKGDIITHFTGYSVLALQGVNSLALLDNILSDFKAIGTSHFLIALDMDQKTNPMVEEALFKIREKISDTELSYQLLYWDESYKGLDDWLVHIRSMQEEG